MKIISSTSIAKPPFLLVHSVAFNQPQLSYVSSITISSYYAKRCGLLVRSNASVAGGALSSKALHLSSSKENKLKKEVDPASFYTHPSLLQMKNERIANIAHVYEFLRGIGIIPDELDGLELPVSTEVMKERVNFLQNLGLSIEDINNFPLVLGCSVKKNMIPVLDYLGKLGVRKSTFTEFLRRYPQVLHASVVVDLAPVVKYLQGMDMIPVLDYLGKLGVPKSTFTEFLRRYPQVLHASVVDLAPVVKYLQGMDIKPNDIPRVLERYPEVLGFKLEGTMSTSVAYLVGIGVARREIGRVLTTYPEILGMRVGRVIKPFVEYMGSMGIPSLAVARLIEKSPHILGFELNERVKLNAQLLLEYNVSQKSLASVIAQYPEILGIDLETKLLSQQSFLNRIIGSAPKDFGRVIEKMPQIVSLSDKAIVRHVNFLKECKFSLEQVKTMVVGCPQLLALNIDIMKLNFDFFESTMNRPLDDLVSFPAYFTYGLASTIKPRHKMIASKGFKCSLSWLLNCSDEKFEERMSYDSFDIEEIEPDSSSFDLNTLMQPVSEDSDSDYEDDSVDEYEDEYLKQ